MNDCVSYCFKAFCHEVRSPQSLYRFVFSDLLASATKLFLIRLKLCKSINTTTLRNIGLEIIVVNHFDLPLHIKSVLKNPINVAS